MELHADAERSSEVRRAATQGDVTRAQAGKLERPRMLITVVGCVSRHCRRSVTCGHGHAPVSTASEHCWQASPSPAELNNVSDALLQTWVASVVVDDAATTRVAPSPWLPFVTKLLLYRLHTIVWKRSREELDGWSKQRALAKLVAMLSGARIPTWADAEQPGQWMDSAVTAYCSTHKKHCAKESKVARRARVAGKDPPAPCPERLALEQELYHCKFGCTPARLPVRITPPGALARAVRFETCDFAAVNLALRAENSELRDAGTQEAQQLVAELEESQRDLNAAMGNVHDACAERDREADRATEERTARVVAELRAAALQAEGKEKDKVTKRQAGVKLELEGKLGKAHVETARHKRKAEQEEERGKLFQRRLAEALERKAKEPSRWSKKRHRERREENKELKRQAADKAQTSENRLWRAATAEEQLKATRQHLDHAHERIDELQEKVEASRVAEERREAVQAAVIAEWKGGPLLPYPWKLRKLIYGSLLMRTPPSAIGANIIEAAALFAPELQVAVPGEDRIRRMRQEATLLGETIACLRVASCKRVLSFGFDETTKMGEGLASVNIQIETQAGEICDEVMRGAFLIPGGTAEQVASSMESKLFARGRRLLQAAKVEYEKKNGGAGAWEAAGMPKPSKLGYHQLVKALIMSDMCNAARAAKQLIIEYAGDEMKRILGPQWEKLTKEQREDATRGYVGDCMQVCTLPRTSSLTPHPSSLLPPPLGAPATTGLGWRWQPLGGGWWVVGGGSSHTIPSSPVLCISACSCATPPLPVPFTARTALAEHST